MRRYNSFAQRESVCEFRESRVGYTVCTLVSRFHGARVHQCQHAAIGPRCQREWSYIFSKAAVVLRAKQLWHQTAGGKLHEVPAHHARSSHRHGCHLHHTVKSRAAELQTCACVVRALSRQQGGHMLAAVVQREACLQSTSHRWTQSAAWKIRCIGCPGLTLIYQVEKGVVELCNMNSHDVRILRTCQKCDPSGRHVHRSQMHSSGPLSC